MKKIRSMYSLKALFYANHFCQGLLGKKGLYVEKK